MCNTQFFQQLTRNKKQNSSNSIIFIRVKTISTKQKEIDLQHRGDFELKMYVKILPLTVQEISISPARTCKRSPYDMPRHRFRENKYHLQNKLPFHQSPSPLKKTKPFCILRD